VLSEVLRIEPWFAALYTDWAKVSNSSWHALIARWASFASGAPKRSWPCTLLTQASSLARSSSFSSNPAVVYFSASRSLLS
jgi:hypothetical protein